jgi:pimeloyl-[acyl-carrier protein] methyl ester esterase
MATPLVALHGWGMDARVWPGDLSNGAQRPWLAVDLPGHGAQRDAPAADFADALERIAAAAPARCHVLGWSLGAQFALAWAASRPAQVERLVLIAATPRFVAAPGWPQGMAPATFDAFAAALAREPVATWRRFLRLQAQGDKAARAVTRALESALGEAPPAGAAVLRDALNWLRDNDLRARCGAVTQPCLVVHGGEDGIVPAAAGEWLAAQLPGARLQRIAAAAHAPFLSAPAAVGAALEAFLG